MRKKKNKMKWIGLGLLILTAIAVAITFLLVCNLSKLANTSQKKETFDTSVSGILPNAYIINSDETSMQILYHGILYQAKQAPTQGYTGVADIELEKGNVVKIYAKSGSIEGTLASYSANTVQIEGYEPLSIADDFPVYLLSGSGQASVRQGTISDLVIGNSKVELVVADQKACAIVSHPEERAEKIRVLIKNDGKNTYSRLYACSDNSYYVDETKNDASSVAAAAKLLKGQKNGTEIRISSESGLLYLCDENGKKQGEGYEGDLIFRKAKDGYVLINELSIEDYIRYVLPSEMPLTFSYEALKAQAVCARTFAYGQMRGDAYAAYGANLDNTTAYQVYHATTSYEITDQAVADTADLVMTYDGKLADCYYYSTSPGYSENLEVWDAKSPGYLIAENHTKEKTKDLSLKKNFHSFITRQADAYDRDSPYFRWTATVSSKMGMDETYGRLKKLKINKRSSSGYILSLTMVFEDGKRTYTRENDIRFALGKYLVDLSLSDGTKKNRPTSVPSACFEIKSQKHGKIVLQGGGFGHGIGLSQYGANAMGEEGKDWKDILSFYFKNVEFTDVLDLDTTNGTVVE